MSIESTNEALKLAGVSNETLTEFQRESLDEKGFCVIPMSQKRLRALGVDLGVMRLEIDRFVEEEGHYAGGEGKEEYIKAGKDFDLGARRLGNLIDKHPMFRKVMMIPEMLAGCYHVLKSDMHVSAMNMRDPRKGNRQPLHIDWGPRENDDDPFESVVCFLFVDSMTKDNSPMRFVPGSHRKLGWVENHLEDAFAPHPDEINVDVPAGGIVIMNANLWHSGTESNNHEPRRTVFLTYRRREIPQLLNQRRYLRPMTMNQLSDVEKYLLSVREEDHVQKEPSVGVGALYSKVHGRLRSYRK